MRTSINVIVFGVIAMCAVSYIEGFSQFQQGVIVYLAMILGALMAIGKDLEKK